MKSLLIGFFQILCVLQVFGAGQLTTNPINQTHSTSNLIHKQQPEHSHFVVKNYKSNSSIDNNSSFPSEETEFVFENIEEETEDFASQKHLVSNLYFAGIPIDQSLDYLYGNSKSNSLFYEHSSFSVSTKRHVVFQVFRI
ncbi:hypothetical protein [Fluviicola taffensis]|uniref:Uncharacterized protein n=1 Tax=Fluviicola taffensis (strain DSM 16823 / NCIMB 13979 / RW262) TaxID=755732 RepID=F2IB61_FLUTR|nr:hypothetical protein [Fluviicola taffensis]AEA42144.1 hypothetical protein Fluta_0134 [Fluviicola taffensis DSM 16823]